MHNELRARRERVVLRQSPGENSCLPLSFALTIILLAGCAPEPAPRSAVIRPVKTLVVAAGGEPHVRTFPGQVLASRKAELAFQVSGLLVELPVREGQTVGEGELIAQL